MYRHSDHLENDHAQPPPPSAMSQVSQMLVKQVHLLYDMQVRDKPNRSKCIEQIKQDQTLLTAMKMLSEAGVKEILYDDTSI
jgi:hypothetical protein